MIKGTSHYRLQVCVSVPSGSFAGLSHPGQLLSCHPSLLCGQAEGSWVIESSEGSCGPPFWAEIHLAAIRADMQKVRLLDSRLSQQLSYSQSQQSHHWSACTALMEE